MGVKFLKRSKAADKVKYVETKGALFKTDNKKKHCAKDKRLPQRGRKPNRKRTLEEMRRGITLYQREDGSNS